VNKAAVPPELNLPDLPEVPVVLGPAPDRGARPRQPLSYRLRVLIGTYFPLLLMALLALSTWFLVKNTPREAPAAEQRDPRHDPDYQMHNFTITRFGADGKPRVRIEGDVLRHYPDTDRIEVDTVHIRALGPGGRATLATARRALANGDVTELQLLGGAQVQAQSPNAETVEIESEFLHLFLEVEQVRSHLPVVLKQGRSEVRAGGIEYDNLDRKLQLQGPVRALFLPRAPVSGKAGPADPS